MNKLINGKQIAADILENLKKDISKKIGMNKIGLAFVLIGTNPASQTYVKMKKKACGKIGIQSYDYELKESTSENELLVLLDKLNNNPNIHGILIQQPFPNHIDTKKIIYAVNPEKDVDGFHPNNIGKMLLGDTTGFISCTPLGIKTLLEKANIEVEGKHVVILGRSNIVGLPLANILMKKKPGANATITVCHTGTSDLNHFTKQADILIAAMGRAEMVTADMVKEQAVIIDVGTNRVDDPTKKRGYRLTGDVHFPSVVEKVKAISPVPGGVGPMTIVMLLKNTVKAAKLTAKLD